MNLNVAVHTPAGKSTARWTWSPQWPIAVRLVVDLPGGGYDVFSFGRVPLQRTLGVHPPGQPGNPESAAWIDTVNGRRVLMCELTPHSDWEQPGPRQHVRALRLWTSWVKAAIFLGKTFAEVPACPYRGWCPEACEESRITQDALVGQLLAQEPTP